MVGIAITTVDQTFFAKLQLDDIIWVGHVEMHCKGSDWYAHHHHLDAAFDNVVLHVVWEDDTPVFILITNKSLPFFYKNLSIREFYNATRNC